jgi:RNA polymerase sigma factor (TIGR02999 family)
VNNVTQILTAIEQGEPSASEKLLPIVYEELRRLAAERLSHEKPGQTLQATALVHEAYIRLVDCDKAQKWNSRGHFFAAAAEAMRRILINRARDKRRLKRGADLHRVDIENIELAMDSPAEELAAIDEALAQLAEENAECANVVKMRFFAGLSIEEAAAALDISASTAKRHWAYARAWIYDLLRPDRNAAAR